MTAISSDPAPCAHLVGHVVRIAGLPQCDGLRSCRSLRVSGAWRNKARVARNDHGVAAEERVDRRVAKADVRVLAGEHDDVNAELAQRWVETRFVERGVGPLWQD